MMSEYAKETDLRNDIINALPKHYISTLNTHRDKFIGKIPENRDQYDPHFMLNSFQNGDKVLVLDSMKLPDDWMKIELSSFRPPANTNSDFLSDYGASSDDAMSEGLNLTPTLSESDSSLNLEDLEDIPPPQRVIVYTTVPLLGLLAKSTRASVDGTFKVPISSYLKTFLICYFLLVLQQIVDPALHHAC